MKRRVAPLSRSLLVDLGFDLASSLHAADPVYMGVGYGLLKSTDAGATWNL